MSDKMLNLFFKRKGKPIEIGDRMIVEGEEVICEGRSPSHPGDWSKSWTVTLRNKKGESWCAELSVGQINAAKYAYVKQKNGANA